MRECLVSALMFQGGVARGSFHARGHLNIQDYKYLLDFVEVLDDDIQLSLYFQDYTFLLAF